MLNKLLQNEVVELNKNKHIFLLSSLFIGNN